MNKRTIVTLLVIMSVFTCFHFLRPEPQRFTTIIDIGKYASANDNYEVIMELCISQTDKSSGWVRGTLLQNGNYSKTSKMIYWDKVERTEQINEEIDVVWIDTEVVRIQNIEFDVSSFPNVNIYNYSAE